MASYPFHYDMPALRISDSEIVVQKQCLDMIAKLFPHTRVAAVPNGQKRTRWQQMQAKREGMSAGFPDLILVGGYPANVDTRNGSYIQVALPLSAYIEIKAGSALGSEQCAWLLFMAGNGHNCGVFRSDRTLEAAMRKWGFR